MSSDASNPFISTQKSDSDIHVVLHPLVILTVTDYVTRNIMRDEHWPVVGAILGRQDGREITMEFAFDCSANWVLDNLVQLDEEWLTQRLDQMKQVHKDRGLDLVGWFHALPRAKFNERVLVLNKQFQKFNESVALLAFHPEEVASTSGGRLPLTIYETVYETDESKGNDDGTGAASSSSSSAGPAPAADESEDKDMKDFGEAGFGLITRLRELPYSVETAQDEMISVDFVARGGTNARASASAPADQQQQPQTGKPKLPSLASLLKFDVKGKRRAVAANHSREAGAEGSVILSREDEERVATLTTKANAIRMLHARIQLIIKYLEGLPPSYFSPGDDQMKEGEEDLATAAAASTRPPGGDEPTKPSLTLLRSIQALVNRVPLLIPGPTTEAFERDMLSEANDVQIISLLNDVLQSANVLRDLGRKFHVVDQARNSKRPSAADGLTGGAQNLYSLNVGDLLV